MWCQVQMAWLGINGCEMKMLIRHICSSSSDLELPRNLILCCLQVDQWQSQSPKASVWNEKYVRLRSKRKMSERKIGRQIECAPMCLNPTKLHGCCMTWATLATQWVDLKANYIQPLYHFPSWSLASVSLGAEGRADHIICYPAWAELPVKKGSFQQRGCGGWCLSYHPPPEQRNHSTVSPSPSCRHTLSSLLSTSPTFSFFSSPLLPSLFLTHHQTNWRRDCDG